MPIQGLLHLGQEVIFHQFFANFNGLPKISVSWFISFRKNVYKNASGEFLQVKNHPNLENVNFKRLTNECHSLTSQN